MKIPHRHRAGRYILLCALALNALHCDTTDPEPSRPNDIDAAILDAMREQGIPSVVAGIVKDGNLVWKRAYGYADIVRQIPATDTTIYTLMSVSKTVLATAVMQLWEQGLIDLDADINTYLPFPVRNPSYPDVPISIRMLMTHSSGLAHPDNEVPGWYHFYPDHLTPRMESWIDQWLQSSGLYYVPQLWKDWAPGTHELYSNIGTWLLGYIVERVGGQEFTSYCETRIFQPLQMVDTGYWLADLPADRVAVPYVEGLRPISQYNSLAYPVGWLRSTVPNMARFLSAYASGGILDGVRILEEATIDTLLTVQNPASGTCLIWKKWLGAWYGHDGGGTGFSSRVEFNRIDKTALVILANYYNSAVNPGGRIYDLIRLKANQYR